MTVRIAQVQVEDGPHLTCVVPAELAIGKGDEGVVNCNGTLEFGVVTSLEAEGREAVVHVKPPALIRRATLQDQAKARENALMSKIARETCDTQAHAHKLDIRLVRVRYNFDRSVLRVLFSSEDRVDFRDMIKALSSDLRTRVDMRQIGVRDEAGIVGGMGPCGRNMCCCRWLKNFESINVKMAKVQHLSLNPGAISGMCGRLKCCLRYEYDQYKEAGRGLPRQGTRVQSPSGIACVLDCDVMSQRVKVRLEDDRVVSFAADELSPVERCDRERTTRNEHSHSEWPESEPVRDPGAGNLRDADAGRHLGRGDAARG